jgi:hypothetical protein
MSKGDSTRGAGSGASRGLFAVLFAAAALCFLLPFGTVSCSGDDKVTVTGVELVTRTVPGAGATQGEPTLAQQVEDDGFVPAVVALVAVLLGLALVVTRPEAIKAIGKAFLITLVGIVALLWLPGTAMLELADFTLGPGFVLALVLELLLACVCVILLLRRRTDRVWTEPILPPGAVPRLIAEKRGPLDDR